MNVLLNIYKVTVSFKIKPTVVLQNKNLTLKKSIKIIIKDVQMTVLFLWVLALFELNMMYIYANKNAMIRSQNIINNLFKFKILM